MKEKDYRIVIKTSKKQIEEDRKKSLVRTCPDCNQKDINYGRLCGFFVEYRIFKCAKCGCQWKVRIKYLK